MGKQMCQLIVSDESTLEITHKTVEMGINGVNYKALSDMVTFDIHITGMMRGNGQIQKLPDLLDVIANRYAEGTQFELK